MSMLAYQISHAVTPWLAVLQDPRAARQQASQAAAPAAAALAAKRGREDSPTTAAATGEQAAGEEWAAQRQRTDKDASSNGVDPATGPLSSGTPPLPPGFEPPLGRGHPRGEPQLVQGAAAPLQQLPGQPPPQGKRPHSTGAAAAASGGLTPEQMQALMAAVQAAQAKNSAVGAAPPQLQPPGSAAPLALLQSLPQLQQALQQQQSAAQQSSQQPLQQPPPAQPQRRSRFDEGPAASNAPVPQPQQLQQQLQQLQGLQSVLSQLPASLPEDWTPPPAGSHPVHSGSNALISVPVQRTAAAMSSTGRGSPVPSQQSLPPPSQPPQQNGPVASGHADGRSTPPPVPPKPASPAPNQRPPPSAQEIVRFIQGLRQVLTEEELVDVQQALAGLAPAKRWPLIDQLRAEFLPPDGDAATAVSPPPVRSPPPPASEPAASEPVAPATPPPAQHAVGELQ